MSKTKKIILITIFVIVMLGIGVLIEWLAFENNRLKRWYQLDYDVEIEIKLENSKEKSVKVLLKDISDFRNENYKPICLTEVDPELDCDIEIVVKIGNRTLQKGKPPTETDHDSIIRRTSDRAPSDHESGEPFEYYSYCYKLYYDKKADSLSFQNEFEIRLYLK